MIRGRPGPGDTLGLGGPGEQGRGPGKAKGDPGQVVQDLCPDQPGGPPEKADQYQDEPGGGGGEPGRPGLLRLGDPGPGG